MLSPYAIPITTPALPNLLYWNRLDVDIGLDLSHVGTTGDVDCAWDILYGWPDEYLPGSNTVLAVLGFSLSTVTFTWPATPSAFFNAEAHWDLNYVEGAVTHRFHRIADFTTSWSTNCSFTYSSPRITNLANIPAASELNISAAAWVASPTAVTGMNTSITGRVHLALMRYNDLSTVPPFQTPA